MLVVAAISERFGVPVETRP